VASEAAQLNPWLSRANALACAALVVSIAYVLVKTVYLFLDDAAGSTAPVVYGSASQGASPAGSAGRRVDAAALSLLHLFGEEGAKPVVQAAPQDVAAPKTRLSLELQGVFVSEEENKSTAMISEARRESQLYRIGDRVPGNATLAAVFADRVLLNLNGKLEALYFPESRMAGGMMPGAGGPGAMNLQGPRSVSARTGRVSGAPQPGMGVSGGGGMGGVGMPSSEAAEAVVNQLREEISANPDAVLGQFGLATNNGRGYKVTDSSNPALTAIGGRPGDVILTVNGRSVGDPAADVALIQEVMESGCVKLGAERDGRQFNAEFCPGQ
jgi:general secretion pathway protein C